MLWDIHNFDRQQWQNALQGDWEARTEATLTPPTLKYYANDHYSDKLPNMRFAILGEPTMNKDYGRLMRTPVAMLELKQFHPKEEPNVWSMPFITVAPSLQGQGVARQLFRHALAWLKEHHPDALLDRTANSPSGIHWQHVGDTELFAAKLPWRQKERAADSYMSGLVRMNDFDSPTARMVDALQRKSAHTVRALLNEHPGEDWCAPNDAHVHPLRAAIVHLPEAIAGLLAAGAKPAIDAGWIGHSLLDNQPALSRWLACFEEKDQGKAFVLALAGHDRFCPTSLAWDALSPKSKEGAAALIQESGAHQMREILDVPRPPMDERWRKNQWAEFAQVLQSKKEPSVEPTP